MHIIFLIKKYESIELKVKRYLGHISKKEFGHGEAALNVLSNLKFSSLMRRWRELLRGRCKKIAAEAPLAQGCVAD